MGDNKQWDVVIDTTFGTIAYSVSRSLHVKHLNCPVYERFVRQFKNDHLEFYSLACIFLKIVAISFRGKSDYRQK